MYNLAYIRINLEVGDNVILFLRAGTISLPWRYQPFRFPSKNLVDNTFVFLMDGFQSVYWYNPYWRNYGDDWIFQAVHPLNQLYLAPAHLESLSQTKN